MSQTTTILGPSVGITDLLDAVVLNKQEEEHAKPQVFNPLRPSAAGYCARKLAYSYNSYKGHSTPTHEIKKPSVIRLLDLGQHIERAVLDQLYRAGMFVLKYKQQSLHFLTLDDGSILEGSPDVMIEFPDGSRGLYDVKSKGDKFSSWRESAWSEDLWKLSHMRTVTPISETSFWVDDLPSFLKELNDEYFAHNFIQTNLYLCNEFMKQRSVSFGGVLRYNKNNSTLMEVRFRPSQEVYDYAIEKFKRVHANVLTPDSVPKESVLGSMSCAFCPYKERCWPEVNTAKEFFKTLPEKQWATDTNRLGSAGEELDKLQIAFDEAESSASILAVIKDDMLKLMLAADKRKIKTANGQVFEAKFLKSPKEHYDVRKGKV